ncbi:MAG: urease accessory protein UreD, partial [Rhodobacteraceae bacterium]|nr:urease accessory protein UreD [Paracoccaceae bacterium]
MGAALSSLVESAGPQRTRGLVRVSAQLAQGGSALADLREEGALRVLFPRPPDDVLDVMLLNTAGGLTGGDKLSISAEAGAGTRLSLTTQAAERAYMAQQGQVAQTRTELVVQPGAQLHWLPQETILFNGAALHRHLKVRLLGDAVAVLVEPVIFGRRAMGETLDTINFADRWEISRDGKLIFADAQRLAGDGAQLLQNPAIGGVASTGAMAGLAYLGPNAASLLKPL